MKMLKRIWSTFVLSMVIAINLLGITPVLAADGESAGSLGAYDGILSKSVDRNKELTTDAVSKWTWWAVFNEQVNQIIGYVIDIFIVIWITVAFIGGYKIMMSSKEDSLQDWIRLVIFGVIGIIIMVSARFLAEWLVWTGWIITEEFANTSINNQPNWVDFASNLYNKILYPFIKVTLYLVIWFLFFLMAAKVVWFVTSTDDSAKKKAGWIIIWCVVGILIIMGSKQLVEAVMWQQDEVLNNRAQWINGWTEVWWMWEQILDFESLPIVIQIINWVMGLTMFIILVLIIIQWYKMFTKPDDPKNRESLKKTLLYIIIWVLVIWAAYAISSVLVVNNIPLDTAS